MLTRNLLHSPVVEDQNQEVIPLGHINGVFGVRGWLKVFSDTKPRENIVQYKNWMIGKPGREAAAAGLDWREVKLLEGKRHGKNVIVRLDGVDTREQAADLVGYQIAVSKSQLPDLPKGEYYWSDLIGLEVVNTAGVTLGAVQRLMETGANDVLVVDRQGQATADLEADSEANSAAAEILIPWVLDHFVVEVDVAARRILVDWEEDY